MEYAKQWQEAFKHYLSDPETGKNFDIISMEVVEERNLEKLISETGKIPEEGEICLEFMTPFPFNREKNRHRTFITKGTFIKSFEKRFSRLFGKNITYQSNNDNFSLFPYYWNYIEIRHLSHSQSGNVQYINGCVGKLYLKGHFKDFLPFLILGSELHTGSKLSNSDGYYILHRESMPFFQGYFPNKKMLVSVIRDVIDRYDSALESLSAEGKFPFDEELFADEILRKIVTDTYTPAPNTAFMIKKKSEVVIEPEEEYRRLKKPLYITEPYLFLSLNGEAIDIKKQGIIQETIPLRRISEIILMEKTTFSTALMTKCTENNIPLTITLNSGYYITTIKPDSKKYHDISYEHARKYYSLTDTEILSIAKEFAVCKLNNYISMFKQRYVKELNPFINEIESYINHIYQAGDIHQAQGFEGAAAKRIYQNLNRFIDDQHFHIRKRQRRNPDRINSLLNFGYYLLFSRINATVRSMGLNPYLGFLHSPEDNFESLVCDIQELFRSRIDRFVIRLINLKVIKKDDFVETSKGYYLTKDGRKNFLNQFEAEMEKKVSKKNLSLKEAIYVQTMVIKNYVLEDRALSFYTWEI